jgi:predicted Ser/Thr protein kinase
MTTQTARCPRCGDQFPEGLEAKDFEGICPNCLAFLAVDKDSDVIPSAAGEDPLQLAAKDPPPLKRGATFHGMEMLELIGQGGMGVVYKARQIELDRLVALKILSPRLAADPEFPRRFNREAQALATLDHSNIVRIHDVGREGELYFIVMEYVDGMNLRDLLVQKKLSPEQALRVIPQICDALEYAHSRGVIHRDIKPENIILSRSGVTKIADFGLAKIVNSENAASSITQTNVVMGTADYMAPEQRDKTKDADHRADIYSLGVVFYELLTGELPVGRFDPPSRRKQVDARLDEVVLRALEKDPDRRYQRASHLGRDVDRITGSTPAAAAECPVVDLSTGKQIAMSPGLRLGVHAVACPLTVRSWEKMEIGIQVDGDYQFDGQVSTPLLQSQVDTRSISIFVPRGVELDATVDEGSAEVAGVVGHVVVKIPDGSLRVMHHEGALRVHGGTGSVMIQGLKSEYFEVRTRTGSVAIDDLELSRGRGQVETEAGSVRVSPAGASSFRYYLEARGGTVLGPPSGQIGAGAGWLTVRTGAGSINFQPPAMVNPFSNMKGFLGSLTPKQAEKVGKYVIVNAGLFLFFLFVAGTIVPAIIVAIFWGISLALEIWKGYVRGHRGGDASPAMEKVFRFVPTPLPDPPPPPPPVRPAMSALAVLALLASIPAFLAGLVAAGMIFFEKNSTGMGVSPYSLGELRLGAFWTAASAFLMGVPALLMGATASSLVREGRGALKGKGIAQAAVFLSLFGTVIPVAYVKPQLAALDRSGREARAAAEQFISQVREEKYADARATLSPALRERVSDAHLQAFRRELTTHPAGMRRSNWVQMAEGGRKVWYLWIEPGGNRSFQLVLEHDARWWVSEIKPQPGRLGD